MAKVKKKAAKPAKKTVVAKKPAAKKTAKPTSKSKAKAKPAAKKAVAAKSNKASKPAKKQEIKHTNNKNHHSGKSAVQHVKAKKGKEKLSKTRYSDSELAEFRELIIDKLDAAKKELKYLQEQISRTGDNSAGDTENKYTSVDDGGGSMEREYLNQMAARQRLYIDHLDKALVRIQNKTYGICRVTGKLIEKDRLRAVPHATLSMEAKLMQGHPQPIPVN